LTIKDLEDLLHVDRANIRYYEKEGLLITRRNPINGYRDYSEENVECLKKIIFLRNLEISIVEIRKFQSGNESIKNVLLKHKENIKEQTEKLDIAIEICNELIKTENITFDNLKLEDYSFYKEKDNKIILKDTIINLYAIKDIVIPWILIIFSLIIAGVSYSLLPEKVATDWYGVVVTKEANRMVIFLIPVVMVGITVFAKAMISNILYFRMPHYLFFVDKIAGYFSICTAIIIVTYQINIVLFMGGIKVDFYSVIFTEILASVGFAIMILFQNKIKVPFNNV
jgi:DNA-binding transcriptional MerR regulator